MSPTGAVRIKVKLEWAAIVVCIAVILPNKVPPPFKRNTWLKQTGKLFLTVGENNTHVIHIFDFICIPSVRPGVHDVSRPWGVLCFLAIVTVVVYPDFLPPAFRFFKFNKHGVQFRRYCIVFYCNVALGTQGTRHMPAGSIVDDKISAKKVIVSVLIQARGDICHGVGLTTVFSSVL